MYITASFSEIIEKISSIGKEIFDKTVGFINNLPSGLAQGIASVVLVFLAAVGIITLLKKSFKVFGIILISIVGIVIILSLIGKI